MNGMDEKNINVYLYNLIIFIFVLSLFVTTTTVFIIVTSVEIKSSIKDYVELYAIVEVEKQKPSVTETVLTEEEPVEQPIQVKEKTPELPSRSKPTISEEDLHLLARIINAEAGDEPYEGMVAVGNVVLNRVRDQHFPDTIRGVIYQKGQFSPVANGEINREPNDRSIRAAKEVIEGARVVSEDVMFFYNPKISRSSWMSRRTVAARIGGHTFAY
jgi:N-acetylmuramoyl-L-alanine amidase